MSRTAGKVIHVEQLDAESGKYGPGCQFVILEVCQRQASGE